MLSAALADWGYYVAKFDYVKAQATAKKLVEKFGGTTIATKVTQPEIDPATGESYSSIDRTFDGYVTPPLQATTKEVDGESILRGDAFCYFDGDEVDVGCFFEIIGATYRAVNIEKLKSVSGVLVYQKVQLRR